MLFDEHWRFSTFEAQARLNAKIKLTPDAIRAALIQFDISWDQWAQAGGDNFKVQIYYCDMQLGLSDLKALRVGDRVKIPIQIEEVEELRPFRVILQNYKARVTTFLHEATPLYMSSNIKELLGKER